MERECVIVKIRRKWGSDESQDVIVQGWPTGLPGLYVTLDYCAALHGFKRYGYTHIKSGVGFHCGNLGCKRVAIRYAKKYFRGLDWTLDGNRVVEQLGIVEAYKRSSRDLTFK